MSDAPQFTLREVMVVITVMAVTLAITRLLGFPLDAQIMLAGICLFGFVVIASQRLTSAKWRRARTVGLLVVFIAVTAFHATRIHHPAPLWYLSVAGFAVVFAVVAAKEFRRGG